MDPFPALDPIPLPAPVWLFKLLHPVTFTLHIGSVLLLLGALALATFWSFAARLRRDPVQAGAAAALVRPLPILMTFVINLGVPPLLFSQVLYGRALYTSSILIGVWWIAVIGLLMAGYHLLYAAAGRAGRGRSWGWFGLLALVLILKIALIYSNNFTLLARPEAWKAMYAHSPIGAQLARGDATLLTRWLFLLAGAGALGGVGACLLGRLGSLDAGVRHSLGRTGGIVAAVCAALQAGLAIRLFLLHTPELRQTLLGAALPAAALAAWALAAAALIAAGFLCASRAKSGALWPVLAACGAALASVAAMVVVREALRDAALRAAGFDVWERRVEANWGVIGLFLALFAGGILGLAWLARVAARAGGPVQPVTELGIATERGDA